MLYVIYDIVPQGHVIHNFVASFYMQLFMTVSGIFAVSILGKKIGDLFWKKFRQLIIPPILWTSISLLLSFLSSGSTGEILIMNASSLLWNSYWFMHCLMTCFLLYWLTNKLFQGVRYGEYWALLLACLASLIIPVSNITFMYPFFWLGGKLRPYLLNEQTYKKYLFLSGLIFAVLVFPFKVQHSIYKVRFSPILYDSSSGIQIDFHNIAVSAYLVLTAFCGVVFFLLLFKSIYQRYFKSYSWFSYFGRDTLGIYMLNFLILSKLLVYLKLPVEIPINTVIPDFLIAPIYAILTLVGSILIVQMLRRYSLTRKLLLGEYR